MRGRGAKAPTLAKRPLIDSPPTFYLSGVDVPFDKAYFKHNYAQKLKDPRWQKKRLEVFDRDHWKCRQCGDSESTLHVHHTKYLPGKQPWEYDNRYLLTLCESCHEDEPEAFNEAGGWLLDIPYILNLSSDQVYLLFDYLYNFDVGNLVELARSSRQKGLNKAQSGGQN